MFGKFGIIFERFFVIAGLIVLTTLVKSGAGEIALAAGPKTGGTITVSVDLEFRGFDPLKATYLQFGDRSVLMAVEERLFGMDGQGSIIPELALSATPSDGGKTWIIKLRQGVTFHDGTPFAADAVVEHWRRMLDPKNHFFGAAFVEPIESVTKVDDFTVRFTLKHPWAPFLTMLSEARWTGAFIPSPKAVRDNIQNRSPVGTGPFIFKEWVANDRLVLVKNSTYWRKGKPYLDTVIFRPVPDNQSRYSGLKTGAADLVLTDWGPHIHEAKSDRSLSVYSADTGGPYTFIINTSQPPLNDARVRRALAHAWNQDLYVKLDYWGTLPVAREPFGGALRCGESGYRVYDTAKAKALIAEYGKPVALELLGADTPMGREAGETMRQLFRDIGVTLKFTPLAEPQLVKRVMGGEYQIAGWRMMDLNDMGPYLNLCLHSKGRLNFSRYQNPSMDELLETQMMSTDEKLRRNALCGVAKLINEDVMYLYGGGRRFHAIARKEVKGISSFDQGLVQIGEVWVEVAETPAKKALKATKVK